MLKPSILAIIILFIAITNFAYPDTYNPEADGDAAYLSELIAEDEAVPPATPEETAENYLPKPKLPEGMMPPDGNRSNYKVKPQAHNKPLLPVPPPADINDNNSYRSSDYERRPKYENSKRDDARRPVYKEVPKETRPHYVVPVKPVPKYRVVPEVPLIYGDDNTIIMDDDYSTQELYRVQVGAFVGYNHAINCRRKMQRKFNLPFVIVKRDSLYRVQTKTLYSYSNAKKTKKKFNKRGVDSIIKNYTIKK